MTVAFVLSKPSVWKPGTVKRFARKVYSCALVLTYAAEIRRRAIDPAYGGDSVA